MGFVGFFRSFGFLMAFEMILIGFCVFKRPTEGSLTKKKNKKEGHESPGPDPQLPKQPPWSLPEAQISETRHEPRLGGSGDDLWGRKGPHRSKDLLRSYLLT